VREELFPVDLVNFYSKDLMLWRTKIHYIYMLYINAGLSKERE